MPSSIKFSNPDPRRKLARKKEMTRRDLANVLSVAGASSLLESGMVMSDWYYEQ